jgi:hypothetical protein
VLFKENKVRSSNSPSVSKTIVFEIGITLRG